jgi:hypothetical protein
MKKEIIIVDKAKGVYRVTTPDERFYLTESKDPKTGLPTFTWKKSVTWIASFYPKGKNFWRWLADKGWSEAEALKVSAGDKGSKVHNAITNLIAGGTVNMEDKYTNQSTGTEEELTVDEYECLMAFTNWANEVKPEFILSEITVESEKYNYAGTVDLIARINGTVYVIDFKTGQYIWPEYELQISAYKQALKEGGRKVDDVKLAFLQVGYRKNKKGYKFTEVEDKFELFLHAMAICENEVGGVSPKQAEYTLSLKIDLSEVKKPEVTPDTPKVKKPNKLTKKNVTNS